MNKDELFNLMNDGNLQGMAVVFSCTKAVLSKEQHQPEMSLTLVKGCRLWPSHGSSEGAQPQISRENSVGLTIVNDDTLK